MKVAAALVACGLLCAPGGAQERPGPLPGGGFLLPNGWTLRPAGRQIALGAMPMSAVLSPDKKYMLALNAGYGEPSVSVLDVQTFEAVDTAALPDAWLGMTFSPDGRSLYVGGGASGSVFEFAFSAEGKLAPKRKLPSGGKQESGATDFIGDVAVSPDGRLIYAASLFRDQVVVINPQSGWVIERFPTARRPYRILFHPDGESFFVTSWAEGSIHHHRARDGQHLSMARLGSQPMDMAWGSKPPKLEEGEEPPRWKARIFVAMANTNGVAVIGVNENQSFEAIETIHLSLWPYQPLGMTPSGLALSEDQERLFVACSGYNTIAVVDVAGVKGKAAGFIPTGWYPTAALALPGGRLVALNGRGGGSFANPNGPDPLAAPQPVQRGIESPGYVARRQKGTASVIERLDAAAIREHTRTVFRNSPYSDQKLALGDEADQAEFPIRHVLYIVKENRTYDEILGDLGTGRGDHKLAVFGEEVTPNHHKLAREFAFFDNFFVNGDVDADGQSWSTAAIASAYIERLWPSTYSGRREAYDYQEVRTESVPAAGYLWTNAIAAGLGVRNYGFLAINHDLPASDGVHVKDVQDPALRDHTSRVFRGFDLDYPDVERAKAFIKDFQELDASGKVPRLMAMRLGNDHTWGATPGKLSAKSLMADNDQALGMIVEACSKSKSWPRMAIFVVEDDAQGGRDHVDSHRAPAFIISPYTRGAGLDSGMYSSASALRTIGLMLGLKPMTHFDAAATPMLAPFRDEPDPTPYTAEKPRVRLGERNGE
ncbi:MAG: bifunctional YncE family protein/alkaline phosphatase family protein [Bryobacteraceae bacterium]|nr:bifunctional YncE family protein/alkaline phosphatase family protein [Bryobacteraceae bacterium]